MIRPVVPRQCAWLNACLGLGQPTPRSCDSGQDRRRLRDWLSLAPTLSDPLQPFTPGPDSHHWDPSTLPTSTETSPRPAPAWSHSVVPMCRRSPIWRPPRGSTTDGRASSRHAPRQHALWGTTWTTALLVRRLSMGHHPWAAAWLLLAPQACLCSCPVWDACAAACCRAGCLRHWLQPSMCCIASTQSGSCPVSSAGRV